MKKALAVAAAGAFIALGAAAPAAHAGEVTGGKNPKPTPIQTRHVSASECAFSGLEDYEEGGSRQPGARDTQNWGQIPKATRDEIKPFASPGMACNPTKSAGEPMRVRR